MGIPQAVISSLSSVHGIYLHHSFSLNTTEEGWSYEIAGSKVVDATNQKYLLEHHVGGESVTRVESCHRDLN